MDGKKSMSRIKIIILPAFMPRGIYFSSFRSSVLMFVCDSDLFMKLLQSFTLKVSQVGYILPTTHQKAFIFGP